MKPPCKPRGRARAEFLDAEANRTALIAGASGLIGGCLLQRLLVHERYASVEILVRRVLPVRHAKLVQRRVDFERLDAAGPLGADTVFCCLGTTIGAAGSQAAFRRVDHDYALALARRAKTAGVQRFLMVSALGADAQSRLFYNRVKGETERDIAALGLPAAVFLRPSLLLGTRREKRRGESVAATVGSLLAPLARGGLRRYRPIAADAVAAAMIQADLQGLPSQAVESEAIAQLAL